MNEKSPKKSRLVTQKMSTIQAASLHYASDMNMTPELLAVATAGRWLSLLSCNWRKGSYANHTSKASESVLDFACKCVCSYCMRVVQMRLAEYLVKFQSSKADFSPKPGI